MTTRIKPEHSSRIKILGLAGWTPQEISNEYPDYHPDQIRNHLNTKYKDEVKGKLQKDVSRGNTKLKHLLKEMFPNAKVETEFAIGKKLRLDCYIAEPYNLGFEYDGIQHFKSVDHFGGSDQHIKNIENDFTKEDLCKGRGISLIRISYQEDLTIDLLNDKIRDAGYGTGIIKDEFKTNREKKKERDAAIRQQAKSSAKLNYEKNKQKIKNSSYHQAQKERARSVRKEQYQKRKAWHSARNNKV